MKTLVRIDDRLLDALADRWPMIEPDYPGQEFGAWLAQKLRYYNEYGYPLPLLRNVVWFEHFVPTLWHYVEQFPPCDYEDYVMAKALELRGVGGTFVQSISRGLENLARMVLEA